MTKKFYGKYRGVVENNIDPTSLARVQVSVPDVMGDGTLAWAMPCFPGAGPGVGLLAIPPQKANVWVEFERGDPDFPIYSGGFWDTGDAPAQGPTQATTKTWVGEHFTLEIIDAPGIGELTLAVGTAAGEATIVADATAMTLVFAGSSVSIGADGVKLNDTNLVVLP